MKKAIVILGPTATGKTEWGINLAKKFNGEIISADSRTIYRYLNIGTAKPKGTKCKDGKGCLIVKGARHYLLDFVNPQSDYTVVNFQRDALNLMKNIYKKGKIPIVVGGSPLYIYALLKRYEFSGGRDKKLRGELEGKSIKELQMIARKSNNISLNKSDFQNKRRLIRAIEKSKKSKSEIRNFSSFPIPYSFFKIGIKRKREEIYERIDKRTETWFEIGFLKEIRGLVKMGLSLDNLKEFGLSYREATKYLSGEIQSISELKKRINYCQHEYVRRQMNWFKKDKNIHWCEKIEEAEKLVSKFLKR